MTGSDEGSAAARGGGDRLTIFVTGVAVLLFVGTGGLAMGDVVRGLAGLPHRFDGALTVFMLLNIAVILLGWRRARTGGNPIFAPRLRVPLAARDPLTGLLSRRGLGEAGAALLVDAPRRRRTVAVLAVEIAASREGQQATPDAANLVDTAATITAILPPRTLAARLDAGRFLCALVFDPRAPHLVSRVAEQLAAALSGLSADRAATVGMARADVDGIGIDALVRSAEFALAGARRAGERIAWFDRTMEQDVHTRDRLEHGLSAAIAAGEIVPWFEPQVALADNRSIGFEVLARWQHPSEGLIEPNRFIPIAEQTGLIAELSLSVIRQALLAAREWDASLKIAVNIAPAQLRDAWFAQKLIKLLSETGVPARRLQVEITERALFDNLPLAQSIAGSLKNQGVTLVLDDFGTGYSSLAHLRALPFDAVKIDTSFVLSMADNAESAAIVTAIAGLGDSLNLPIAAEGVETQAAEERLRALGVTSAQGWRYGKPMPVTGVRRMLAEKRMLATSDDSFKNRRLAV